MSKLQSVLSQAKVVRAFAAGAIGLAAGGIVLLRAPERSNAAPMGPSSQLVAPTNLPTNVPTNTRAPGVEFRGPWAHGRIALSQGSVQANGTRQVYAELRLTGDPRPETTAARPVAMALVLDVSGSMDGEKIAQARESVLSMVAQMRDDDRISLVTYSDSARVVQPMARVGDVRAQLQQVVPTIAIEGGTNIPSGLMMGAQTLSEAPEGTVRRVVLMSDGRDGSGRALDAIANDVRMRADQGVTLSSLGVGADYDEQYMSRLADAGRGNYEFLRDGAQLRAFLGRELRQATDTTVERAVAEVTLPTGWRLTRAYGAEATVAGAVVRLPIGAIAGNEERRYVLDLAVDAPASVGSAGGLTASLAWHAVPDSRDVRVDTGALTLAVVQTEAEAIASRDAAVFAEAESTMVAARQQDAVNDWRSGNVARAQTVATQNLAVLRRAQAAAPTAARNAQIAQFERDNVNFGAMSAGSEAGRAYGLGANARHRAALRSAAAY